MHEIEVKILEINKDEVISKLESLGAKKIFEGIVAGGALDFPDKRIVKKDELLRLRRENSVIKLVYKEKSPIEGVSSCNEFEVEVSDFDKTLKIFNLIGVDFIAKNSKLRTSYTLDGVRFEIDEIQGDDPYIPTFLELEVDGDVDKIFVYAEKLGFKKEDCLDWHGWKLKEHYLANPHSKK